MPNWRTDASMSSPFAMFCSVFILMNRFHVAVGLNSNRSQTPTNMESICYGNVTICNTNVMQFLSQVKILLKLL